MTPVGVTLIIHLEKRCARTVVVVVVGSTGMGPVGLGTSIVNSPFAEHDFLVDVLDRSFVELSGSDCFDRLVAQLTFGVRLSLSLRTRR
ncbi:hypothetical protein FHR84_000881 [Actinopolyspora biskrensis]|uniref:Uncharacterized protein n=1 Tax=Actinopolyspora biskrensis TaxID=1470178 RepID=A0A852Z5A9_9ACTN|nr:hypothetical protein [Actinopolyspora biskrensis]